MLLLLLFIGCSKNEPSIPVGLTISDIKTETAVIGLTLDTYDYVRGIKHIDNNDTNNFISLISKKEFMFKRETKEDSHTYKDSFESFVKAQELLSDSKLRSLDFLNMKLDENIHNIELLIRTGSEKSKISKSEYFKKTMHSKPAIKYLNLINEFINNESSEIVDEIVNNEAEYFNKNDRDKSISYLSEMLE